MSDTTAASATKCCTAAGAGQHAHAEQSTWVAALQPGTHTWAEGVDARIPARASVACCVSWEGVGRAQVPAREYMRALVVAALQPGALVGCGWMLKPSPWVFCDVARWVRV